MIDKRIIGIDACKKGWVGVELAAPGGGERREFHRARLAKRLGSLVLEFANESNAPLVVVVDIPLGEGGRSRAETTDSLARKYIGARASSIFVVPPYEAAIAATSDRFEAQQISEAQTGKRISSQTFGIMPKIVEANEVASNLGRDVHVYEGHPEVSFRAMNGDAGGLVYPKTEWGGFKEREKLLRNNGIVIADDLGDANHAKIDDILDAAALAWTAGRIADGVAESFPPDFAFADVRRVSVDAITY